MKISKNHLNQLKLSKKYRGEKKSAILFYVLAWKAHLANIILFSILIYIAYKYIGFEHSIFIGGALFGLLLRDLAWRIMLAKFWPVSDAVTNWDKVDKIIEENET